VAYNSAAEMEMGDTTEMGLLPARAAAKNAAEMRVVPVTNANEGRTLPARASRARSSAVL